jgi:chromosome segregation protein
MFLKSIKARGFKSFARPVDFAFEPGITVVVGPNGSGKSNIADAVLWAMGEQSPTAVRGSTMQDVIFSGSDKMQPAGMAEVEILIDNSNDLLPIEFSEVQVSRRLHRDGEGSYYINKSPCRLIDVTELLSDAGLGRDGHSIISQGKVDLVLESKTTDRRAHIEEAAGLGKFKKRRHRAELKLEQVRRNLERLTDVEEELKANLRPLKRQATAAERSAKLDLQIAQAQSQLLKGKLGLLQAEMDDAESSSQAAISRRAELEKKLAATADERRRTEEMLSQSLQDHKQLAARFYSLKSQRDNLGHRRSAVEERGEMVEQAAGRAEARIGYLKGQTERVTNELRRAEQEHREQQARLEEIEAELQVHQEKLSIAEKELDRRQRANEEATRKVGELSALKDRYKHQLEYLEQRMVKLEAAIERDVAESEAGAQKLEQITEACRNEETELAEWRSSNEAAEAVTAELDKRYTDVEDQLLEVDSGLRRVAEDLQIAKARLTFISDSDRDRSGFPPAAKKISEEYGVRALVDLIEVEPGYEKSVSAVLGSSLFALTARNMREAGDMLRSVRETRLGSVEFLIPGAESGSGIHDSAEDRLVDHVSIPPEAAFIEPLLKNVRFIEDISDIDGMAVDRTWVTRDGVVYHAGRRLLSYKADPPSSVVLKQRNERRHLEQEREEASNLRRQLEQRQKELKSDLEELTGEKTRVEQQLRDTASRFREAENKHAGSARRCSVLEQEIELKKTSEKHLVAEKDSLMVELLDTRRSLREAESALADAQPATAEGEPVDDETLAAQKHTLAQQVTDLKIAAARSRERERVSGSTIERTRPALERLRQDFAAAKIQLKAFNAYGPVCGRLIAAINRLETAHAVVAEQLESQLKEAEELSDRQSTSLRQLSQAETGLQQELSRASDVTTDREVTVTRLRDHHEEMEQRLKAIIERNPDAGLEEIEAAVEEELEDVEGQVERLLRRRELIGPVNPLAKQEYEEMLERQQFLEEQRADLEKSLRELTGLIRELTNKIENAFSTTFEAVQKYFTEVVSTLFPGGEGRLTLTEEKLETSGEDEAEEEEEAAVTGTTRDRRGIEISVKPARKAVRSLSLLSGGERSLVAIAFLFAIFLTRPAPFYILDEVEAALDDQNISRLLGMLRSFQDRTQFIVITHQKRTMEVADVLYGVSMGDDGTSKVLSRRMASDDDSPGGSDQDTLDTELEPAVAG